MAFCPTQNTPTKKSTTDNAAKKTFVGDRRDLWVTIAKKVTGLAENYKKENNICLTVSISLTIFLILFLVISSWYSWCVIAH